MRSWRGCAIRERGCPWDLEQTFATIAPYTIEEAYEVADAIERGDLGDLKDELGDLLFQVVFHARMAEEAGAFAFADVARRSTRRCCAGIRTCSAPRQVADSAEQTRALGRDQARGARRRAARLGVLDDVPVGLPALTRAVKLGKRAATVGFDWPDVAGVRAKVDEELAELDAAVAARGDRDAIAAEMGDLLFSIANWCRHLELDPETCLRPRTRDSRAVSAPWSTVFDESVAIGEASPPRSSSRSGKKRKARERTD